MHSLSRFNLMRAWVAAVTISPIALPVLGQSTDRSTGPTAEHAAPLRLGSRVRLTVAADSARPSTRPLIGDLHAATRDSIVLAVGPLDRSSVARSAVTTVEVSAGQHRQPGKGFVIGALAGGG